MVSRGTRSPPQLLPWRSFEKRAAVRPRVPRIVRALETPLETCRRYRNRGSSHCLRHTAFVFVVASRCGSVMCRCFGADRPMSPVFFLSDDHATSSFVRLRSPAPLPLCRPPRSSRVGDVQGLCPRGPKVLMSCNTNASPGPLASGPMRCLQQRPDPFLRVLLRRCCPSPTDSPRGRLVSRLCTSSVVPRCAFSGNADLRSVHAVPFVYIAGNTPNTSLTHHFNYDFPSVKPNPPKFVPGDNGHFFVRRAARRARTEKTRSGQVVMSPTLSLGLLGSPQEPAVLRV